MRQRPSGRWVAGIKDSLQKVRLWLGTFDAAEDAARAYDHAARSWRGASARTNFDQPVSSSNRILQVDKIEPFSFEEVCGSKGKEATDFLHALRAKLLDGKGLKIQLSPVMQTADSVSNNNNNNNHNAAPSMATALPVQDFGGEVGASDGGGVQWGQPAYGLGWTRTGPMAMSQAPESAMFGVAAAAASAWSLPPVTATVDLSYSKDTPMDGFRLSEYNENGGWSGSRKCPLGSYTLHARLLNSLFSSSTQN